MPKSLIICVTIVLTLKKNHHLSNKSKAKNDHNCCNSCNFNQTQQHLTTTYHYPKMYRSKEAYDSRDIYTDELECISEQNIQEIRRLGEEIEYYKTHVDNLERALMQLNPQICFTCYESQFSFKCAQCDEQKCKSCDIYRTGNDSFADSDDKIVCRNCFIFNQRSEAK